MQDGVLDLLLQLQVQELQPSMMFLHISTIFLKFPELWTATKFAKNMTLIKVRGVLKTSRQWLLKCMKQNISKVLSDYVINALC